MSLCVQISPQRGTENANVVLSPGLCRNAISGPYDKSGTFRFFALAALTLVLPVSGASAGSLGDNGAHTAPLVIRRRH